MPRLNSDTQHIEPRRNGARLRVGFLLMPHFTLTAFSSFVDILRLSADEGDGSRPIDCTWHIMSPNMAPMKSSCGIAVEPTAALLPSETLDYVVIVGGLLHGGPLIDPRVSRYLHYAATLGTKLVGVCTGGFTLCRLGLMKGRKCCVSWFHYRDFTTEFPDLTPVADRLYVIDRDRITCSGGVGVADLAARLVQDHLGVARATKALHILLVDHLRTEMSAQPAPPMTACQSDGTVSRALLLMEQNLAEPVPIDTIATRLKMSTRQLQRMFKASIGTSPQESYMALRLKHAKWMLENTRLSATAIAAELGFADGAHLSRSFKCMYSVAPIAYRSRGEASPEMAHFNKARAAAADENRNRRIFE